MFTVAMVFLGALCTIGNVVLGEPLLACLCAGYTIIWMGEIDKK